MAAGLRARVRRQLPGLLVEAELAVPEGHVLAILGPSGAGKTTLLRCLAGLDSPDAGDVWLGDERWHGAGMRPVRPQARGVGMVFRPAALFPHLSARENVAFGGGTPARVAELLKRLELEEFAGRYPRQLSAGEQQRVAIARALAPAPRLLLMDEPFTALDPALEQRLHDAFRDLATELGAPVVLVTHDLAEAAWLADSVAVMSGGRLLQVGPTAEVLERPASVGAARILGVTNLFAGVVEGGRLLWGRHALVLPDAPDGPVCWGIRPERVQIATPDTPGANRVAAVVQRLAPAAGQWRVALDVPGGGALTALLPASDQGTYGLRVGQEIQLELSPVHLLTLTT